MCRHFLISTVQVEEMTEAILQFWCGIATPQARKSGAFQQGNDVG